MRVACACLFADMSGDLADCRVWDGGRGGTGWAPSLWRMSLRKLIACWSCLSSARWRRARRGTHCVQTCTSARLFTQFRIASAIATRLTVDASVTRGARWL